MTTPEETTKAIKDFAIKVRAALGDLDPQEIQDLTDGLEADLAERAAEQGIAFGSAASYANELRSAAGLDPRSESASAQTHIDGGNAIKPKRRPLYVVIVTWWAGKLEESLVLAKTWAWVTKFQAFWWVLRGYAVFLLLTNGAGVRNGLLPQSKLHALFALACVLSSFVLGMKFWKSNWFLRLVSFGGQVFTVFAVIGTLFGAYSWQDGYWNQYNYQQPAMGIYQNGREITNIFAYDSKGNRIPLAQLFDQNGVPIGPSVLNTNAYGLNFVNTLDADGNKLTLTSGAMEGNAQAWNAWPLLKTSNWPDNFSTLPTIPLETPVGTVPKLTITAKHLLPAPAATPTSSESPSSSPTPSSSGK